MYLFMRIFGRHDLMSSQGGSAAALAFGAHRKADAVVIPFELYS